MRYTDGELAALDLDWFAVDKDGFIAHFATAGGSLPASVADHKENHERIIKYFRLIPATRRIGKPDTEFGLHVVLDDAQARSRYLEDFRSMGMRGLYSYDAAPLTNGHVFVRIYSPEAPLRRSELPPEIAMILSRTSIALRFADHPILSLENFS